MLLAGPISHTSTQYTNFVDFLHFNGFVYQLFCSFWCVLSFPSCHSILECCVTFSGVKLSIKSFVLFKNIYKLSGTQSIAAWSLIFIARGSSSF